MTEKHASKADIASSLKHLKIAPVYHVQHTSSRKAVWISAGVILAAFVIFVGAYFYALRGSFAVVKTGGVTVAKNSDKKSLEQTIKNKFTKYTFSVTDENNLTQRYYLNDAGLTIDPKNTVHNALSYQKNLSIVEKLSFWRTFHAPIIIKKDSNKQQVFITKNLTHYISPAKNATLTYVDGDLRTTPDARGEAYTIKKPRQQLDQMAAFLTPKRLYLTQQSVDAPVTLKDVEAVAKKAREVSTTPITLTIKDKTFIPDQGTILGWVEPITDTNVRANFDVNSGRIQQYIDDITAEYVSPAENEVSVMSGGLKTIIVPGRTGSEVINKTAIVETIHKKLVAQQPITQDLNISEASFTSTPTKIYPKWIVVDTTNKTLDAYEYSSRVKRLLVSAGRPDTPTPIGQYRIYSKLQRQDMRGRNADGSNYFQPNVEWINYFYQDYAIHGNYWRPTSYFGSVNSSHGCVGLLNPDAEWVYNWAQSGTPVIIHR
jgi:lipoprotein-anchoring transpeptidase ErfK/SrfK